jgi:hypothetical protein
MPAILPATPLTPTCRPESAVIDDQFLQIDGAPRAIGALTSDHRDPHRAVLRGRTRLTARADNPAECPARARHPALARTQGHTGKPTRGTEAVTEPERPIGSPRDGAAQGAHLLGVRGFRPRVGVHQGRARGPGTQVELAGPSPTARQATHPPRIQRTAHQKAARRPPSVERRLGQRPHSSRGRGGRRRALQEQGRELAVRVQDELGTDGWEVLYQILGRMYRVHPPASWPIETWEQELLGYKSQDQQHAEEQARYLRFLQAIRERNRQTRADGSTSPDP